MIARSLVAMMAFMILMVTPAAVPFAAAQTRVNDHDMEAMIRNLRTDSKSFQSAFNDSIRKSTIRGTSQEKEGRNLVETFVKQVDNLQNHFKKTKNVGPAMPAVLDTAERIDKVVSNLQLDQKTTARWRKVRTELDQLAKASGVENPLDQGASHLSPNAAPPTPIGSPSIGQWLGAGASPNRG